MIVAAEPGTIRSISPVWYPSESNSARIALVIMNCSEAECGSGMPLGGMPFGGRSCITGGARRSAGLATKSSMRVAATSISD
eukprot:scaffold33472_cov57-Phaeocystis_antarctica.AAC.4